MHKNLTIGQEFQLEQDLEGDNASFYKGDNVRVVKIIPGKAVWLELLDGWNDIKDWVILGEEGELVGR